MPSATAPAVVAEDVRRHYTLRAATIRAVDGVSLEVKPGEFVALLGASGSGKSTLLNLIAGLDRPSSGSIRVLGRELASMNSVELAQYRRLTVGMVFQAFNLISTMTLMENVDLPMRFAEVERGDRLERARAALNQVGIAHRADHRPTEVSGGEQQRAALARALVNRPAMLLADEPTGNLDSRTGEDIMLAIRKLNDDLKMTVVLVTHERALAERYADRLITLADGKVVGVSDTERSAEAAREAAQTGAPGGSA